MKWFWILGVLLGAGGPVRAQMDSVAIRLEKIKTATEDSVRLEYAGEIEYFIRSSAFGSYRTEKPVKYLGYKRSDDAGIELFSWAVPLREGQAFYNLFRFKNPERSYLIKALPGDRMAWLFYDFVPFEEAGVCTFAGMVENPEYQPESGMGGLFPSRRNGHL